MPAKEPPPGACPQCWEHVEGGKHRSNWLGLFGEEDCPACTDHYLNGCPTVVPKKSRWW